ncbi:MAG: 16S rRNA (uracil(1498)-N(3))-methyltransferase [Clostridia bacterium]|nr:16S rRNA (uracil(1498)-N(3))-methyltransferase [Clostridia bacterium]MBR0140557.1 16S rRNA (uracil(1498)-N(3))-methyltransferase [Bacillota bacterium]
MHRFRIAPEDAPLGRARLSEEEKQHALKVLRLASGDPVEATDGCGRAWEGVMDIDGEDAFILLGAPKPSTEAPVRLTVYMGIPKGEKLELIAQKLTELGCARLVPVRMERSVAKIAPGEADKKLSRARRISAEAIKQCGRQAEMEIADPIDFGILKEELPLCGRSFFMWEKASGDRLADFFEREPLLNDIGCVIGPEGGISDKEAEALCACGALPVTMGPRILRAETAAIAACAQIMTLWGDM